MSAGRPTSYKEEYCELAFNYCRLGAVDDQLAVFFDVCVATINNWKNDYPEFLESLKKGKMQADIEVAQSLFKGATGYTQTEEKVFINQGSREVVDVDVFYAGIPTSQIFWLKNRRPDEWRERQEINYSGAIAHSDMDDDQRKQRRAELQRKIDESLMD